MIESQRQNPRQKQTVHKRHRDRRVAKKARTDARWAPYTAKRVAAEQRMSGFLSEMTSDYRFYTALCLAMASAGFFQIQFIEVVALVGALAMWQHWARMVGTPAQLEVPLFKLWLAISFITIPLAGAGVIAMLTKMLSGFVASM